jgi:hypothetical protein
MFVEVLSGDVCLDDGADVDEGTRRKPIKATQRIDATTAAA